MADDSIFERARGVRASIRAQNQMRRDEQALRMLAQALDRFGRVVVSFEAAIEALNKAKALGLAVQTDASVPPEVTLKSSAEFLGGNDLPALEATLASAVQHLDGSVDIAYRDAIVELDGHPAGDQELEVLASLDLEVAVEAIEALSAASERWVNEVQEARRPDLERAERLATALDDAWRALEESGVSQHQVQLVRRLAGDCVPLTTVDLEDLAWLFDVGFASTLKLCSNSRGR